MDYNKILNEAAMAGNQAQKDIPDGFPCGGAYTVVKPARGKFYAYCKANNLCRPHYQGGFTVDYPVNSDGKQNMYAREAAEEAFAETLRKYGINAIVISYID